MDDKNRAKENEKKECLTGIGVQDSLDFKSSESKAYNTNVGSRVSDPQRWLFVVNRYFEYHIMWTEFLKKRKEKPWWTRPRSCSYQNHGASHGFLDRETPGRNSGDATCCQSLTLWRSLPQERFSGSRLQSIMSSLWRLLHRWRRKIRVSGLWMGRGKLILEELRRHSRAEGIINFDKQ